MIYLCSKFLSQPTVKEIELIWQACKLYKESIESSRNDYLNLNRKHSDIDLNYVSNLNGRIEEYNSIIKECEEYILWPPKT